MAKRKKKLYYTVYLNETDEIVASGNSEECKNQLNKKSIQSFYSLVSKNRAGIRKKYTIVIDEITEECF